MFCFAEYFLAEVVTPFIRKPDKNVYSVFFAGKSVAMLYEISYRTNIKSKLPLPAQNNGAPCSLIRPPGNKSDGDEDVDMRK